jgi:L-asparaginase II
MTVGVRPEQFAPLAVMSRSGVDESVHFGAVVGLNSDGSDAFAVGDPAATIYPRSSTKPLQALAMVRAGLSLPSELLALVCASHNGEQVHLDGVRAILASAGLDESALGNTVGHPLDIESQHQAIRDGVAKSPLQMNCSGKHAGMLATCKVNGWPLEGYLNESHPLQQAITDAVPTVAGESAAAIGVDGCGAPAHVVTLRGLARVFRSIAIGDAGDAGTQVYKAMSQHPYMVGGRGRHVTAIVSSVKGLFAKDGAEAVYAAALPDGRAVALKVSDGGGRGEPTVLLAALEQLGVDVSHVPESVHEIALGHGKPVGRLRAVCFGDTIGA